MFEFYRIKIEETPRGTFYTAQKRKIFRKWKDLSLHKKKDQAKRAIMEDFKYKPVKYERVI